MDKSWVDLDRRTIEYRIGMEFFLNEAFAKTTRKDKIVCPCKKCCNRYTEIRRTVEAHLVWHGMDPAYKKGPWTHHGEPYINLADGGQLNFVEEGRDEGDEGEMYNFLNETFVQPILGDNVGSSRHELIFEGRTPETEKFYKLLEEADKELYPSCKKYKKLDAVVKLFQIKCLGNVTNYAFTLFLKAFSDMLPDGNCLPTKSSEIKKITDDLGLAYEKIDACPNDCMLFWKDTSKLNVCSRCGASRYKVNENGGNQVAEKVLRYFPLIPRLKRLYMSSHTAESMRWHRTECPKDGFMRHPSDSPAWKHLDGLYLMRNI